MKITNENAISTFIVVCIMITAFSIKGIDLMPSFPQFAKSFVAMTGFLGVFALYPFWLPTYKLKNENKKRLRKQ